MFWFRVELDAAGKVLSCRQVDEASSIKDGAVFYYRALSAKAAGKLAYNKYHAMKLAERRQRYESEGKCKCGRTRENETAVERNFRTCVKCRESYGPQHQRAVARAKGQTPVPPPSKADHFAERRKEEKRELLEIVLDQFQRMTMRQFGEWLHGQIDELTEKPAPKLRVVTRG